MMSLLSTPPKALATLTFAWSLIPLTEAIARDCGWDGRISPKFTPEQASEVIFARDAHSIYRYELFLMGAAATTFFAWPRKTDRPKEFQQKLSA